MEPSSATDSTTTTPTEIESAAPEVASAPTTSTRGAGAGESVSIDEYRQGFRLYVQCVEGLGGRIINETTDPASGLKAWGVDSSGVAFGVDIDDCYREHFAELDARFAAENPLPREAVDAEQLAFFDLIIAACLDENEVDYVRPASTSDPEWARLTQLFNGLEAAGQCTDFTNPNL